MEEVNIELADILEVDAVLDTDELESFESWDSLAILSLMAFIDETYNVQLFNVDLANLKTLANVKELIESKKQ
jgi:acyl carrier protein